MVLLFGWLAACTGDRPSVGDEEPGPVARPDTDTAGGSAGAGVADPAGDPATGGPQRPGGEPLHPDEDSAGYAIPWASAPLEADAAGTSMAVLQAVRVAGHDGFDRIVLDFGTGPMPGYVIRYLDGPAHQCGSGRPVDPGAAHGLEIAIRSTAAHDDGGRPTVEERERRPALVNLQALSLICDFEGHVDWLAGVAARSALRVLQLDSPTRLVLDIAHPEAAQAQQRP